VDGTIEINQAMVLANGGFPYTISASGSYRLTGNLTVPAGTNRINVTPSNVTIDLNGFSITGPGDSSASGIGINASAAADARVENGMVTGFLLGVGVGNFGIVRKAQADANRAGIDGGASTVIEACTQTTALLAGLIASGPSPLRPGERSPAILQTAIQAPELSALGKGVVKSDGVAFCRKRAAIANRLKG